MAALAKDPAAIKLFGRTISLPETQFSDSDSLDNGSNFIAKTKTLELRNGTSLVLDEVVSFEQPQTSIKQPITNPKDHHPQDQSDSSREPKQMKRPDKILPCPRCNSCDTKFCYFNNYNVNQPRHFCKSCQRYWTTGGTVRNVPVGAGRRRNKHLASQYRGVMASTDVGLTMVRETFDSTSQLLTCEESSSSSSPNHEMVLKFGPESPYCDNAGASLTGSSFATRPVNNDDVSSQHQMYHYIVPPQSHITTSNVPTSNSSVSLAVPGFATPNMTYQQLVPAAYMNCIPLWVGGSGNVSLVVSNGSQLQVLGKHSRDVNGALEGSTTIEEEGISAPKSSKNS